MTSEAISESHLIPMIKRYFENDVSTAAHNIELLSPVTAAELLTALSPSMAGGIFSHLSAEFGASIIRQLPDNQISKLMECLGSP